MGWSYDKLWIMLINRKLKRTDLIKVAGINSHALAKMGKSEPVTTEALAKICTALNCRLEDIVEFLPEQQEKPKKDSES